MHERWQMLILRVSHKVTTFYVRCAGKKGEIKLQFGKNRPEDVKKFRLEHGIKFRFRKADKEKKEDHTA